jgi:hypothetical protein
MRSSTGRRNRLLDCAECRFYDHDERALLDIILPPYEACMHAARQLQIKLLQGSNSA